MRWNLILSSLSLFALGAVSSVAPAPFGVQEVLALPPPATSAPAESPTPAEESPATVSTSDAAPTLSSFPHVPTRACLTTFAHVSGLDAPYATFTDVAASSRTDAWIVGSLDDTYWHDRTEEPTGDHPFAVHWDGAKWGSTHPGGRAALGETYGGLYGVAPLSPSDAWTVGVVGKVDTQRFYRAHWDGSTWSEALDPGQAPTHELDAIAGSASDDVWAAGAGTIEHWNGSAWSTSRSIDGRIWSLRVVSRDEAWSLGKTSAGSPLVLHWDGKTWDPVTLNGVATDGLSLRDVAAVARDDVWVLGYRAKAPVFIHWDGLAWKTFAPPDSFAADGTILYGIAAATSDDVWAVGSRGDAEHQHSVIAHWNGHRWGRALEPTDPKLGGAGFGEVAVAGDRVWAVGTQPLVYLPSQDGYVVAGSRRCLVR